jgi:hypothetical protein
MRKKEKQHNDGNPLGGKIKVELDNEIDALFALPLGDFTGARNTLAARLKKSGRGDNAGLVKTLVKPSISAWAVNQLYWNHREAFDQLLASGERFHKAQTSRLATKVVDMRAALAARREALTHLSDLATSMLRDAGHNPTLDTVRRITTTLEAMSVYASRSDAPRPGRLTHDVDPPGFESLASFILGATMPGAIEKPARSTQSQKASGAHTKTRRKLSPDDDVRQLQETRKARIAAAKVSLQDARRSLTAARAKAESVEAEHRKAVASAKHAEKQKKDAEESLKKAKAAAEDAARRARSVAVEAQEAGRAVKDAERAVQKLSKELEAVFRGRSNST